MHPSAGEYAAWLLSFLLQLGTAAVMVRNRSRARYPNVFAYLVFWTIANPALLILKPHYAAYFYSYWTMQAISYVLQVRIAAELFRSLALRLDRATVRFFLAVICLFAAAYIAFAGSPASSWISASILAMQRTQDALFFFRFALFLFMVAFAGKVGFFRDGVNFKVAAGYGLYAGLGVLLAIAPNDGHPLHPHDIAALRNWAYVASLLMWFGAFLQVKRLTHAQKDSLIRQAAGQIEADYQRLKDAQ